VSTIGSSPFSGSSPIAIGICGTRAHGYGLPYLIAIWNVGMRGACDELMDEEPETQATPPYVESCPMELRRPVIWTAPVSEAVDRPAVQLSKPAPDENMRSVRQLVYAFVRIKSKGNLAKKHREDIEVLLLHWE